MFESPPTVDAAAEADRVSVRPAPGAVFLRLRRTLTGDRERCMFVELTTGEAVALRRALDDCIGVAAAAATD